MGRLGSALNGMLSQIEAAFAERTVVGVAAASFRGRRVARAAHPADVDPRLRRAVAQRRLRTTRPLAAAPPNASSTRRRAWACWSMTCFSWPASTKAAPSSGSPSTSALVVRDAVEAARAVDRGRPISLEVSGPVFVDGDAARLRQVVDNLLRNAIVHTPTGTPVHVSVRRRDGARRHLGGRRRPRARPPTRPAALFDRFYRGSEARTGRGHRSRVCRSWPPWSPPTAGAALVRSTPGKGTVFTVELPVLRGHRCVVSRSPIGPIGPTSGHVGPAGDVGNRATGRRRRESTSVGTPDHDQRPVRH